MYNDFTADDISNDQKVAPLLTSIGVYERMTRHLLTLSTQIPVTQSEKLAHLESQLQAERSYARTLALENNRLHHTVIALNQKLVRAEKVVSFCRTEIAVAHHDNVYSELEHLKDLLFVSEYDFEVDCVDVSMPISAQVSPSHHSMSFQSSSPCRQPIHTTEVGTIREFIPEEMCFLDRDVMDVADVGPPMSPPGTSHLVPSVSVDIAAAEETREQERVDLEDSKRGSAEVEQDLERS